MATTLLGIKRGTPQLNLEGGTVATTKYSRTYLISSDAPTTDDEITVLNTTGLPDLYDTWAGDTNTDSTAIVRRINVYADEHTRSLWYVDVEYDSETDASADQPQTGGSGGSDPVDLSPEIEWDYETIERESPFDAYGKYYATSAGEPYPGQLTVPRSIAVLTYSRWQASFTAATIIAYVDHVNSTVFSGGAEKTVLMAGIRARIRRIQGVNLWWVTYTMKYDPFTWVHKKWDTGTRDVSGTAAVDSDGNRCIRALNGQGAFRGLNSPPAVNEFNVYLPADFNQLGL